MFTTIPEDVTALSLDIWKTLLRGNKQFTRARLRLIFDELGLSKFDVERLYEAYKLADRHFNDAAVMEGVDYGMADRLDMMFDHLGINAEVPDAEAVRAIQLKVGQLRRRPEYLPTFIEPDLPVTLRGLRDKGYKLGLLSNTGMDNGDVMQPVLEELGIWDLFQTRIFTSEDGRAKPNVGLFYRICDELEAETYQVLHVGDNVQADYCGAVAAGLPAVLFAPKGPPDNLGVPFIISMKDLLD